MAHGHAGLSVFRHAFSGKHPVRKRFKVGVFLTFSRYASFVETATDDGIGLQFTHPCPLCIGFDQITPPGIKPQHGHFAIIRQQFIQVFLNHLEVIFSRQGTLSLSPCPVIPVLGLRIIHTELEALLGALRGELLDNVAFERRGIHYVVIRGIGIEEAEPVVVLGRDDHVFHASLLGEGDPLFRIEIGRVELRRKGFAVDFAGDAGSVHYPLRAGAAFFLAVVLALPFATGNGVEPPVDKHTVTRISPPFHMGVALRCGKCLRGHE